MEWSGVKHTGSLLECRLNRGHLWPALFAASLWDTLMEASRVMYSPTSTRDMT